MITSQGISSLSNGTIKLDITIDNNGVAITTGVKGFRSSPMAGLIVEARMYTDLVGSIVVDIWKDTYVNFPPTVADTITAAAKPTIAAGRTYRDTTLTGWIRQLAAGDIFGFNVDSATTVTRVTLELYVIPN